MKGQGRMKMPHTACYPGKRVLVVLWNGEKFIDRFKDRTNKDVFFEEHGKIWKGAIKSFTIYKPRV